MTNPRVAVIGLGSIGRRHAANLTSLGVEVVGSDADVRRCRQASQDLDIECFPSSIQAYAGSDAALICTSTAAHVGPAFDAMQAGLHVFIEKPLSHSLEGIPQLITMAIERELVTLVGCNMRWHPGPREIKNDVTEGNLGQVLGGHFEFGSYLPDWHPDEDYRSGYSARRELGGGILLDAIHEIDLCRWIMGRPTDVTCVAERVSSLEIDTEDLAEVLLRFDSGAIGSIHLDYLQRSYHRAIRLICEEGTTEWNWHAGHRRYDKHGWSPWKRFDWEPNDMYMAEMEHFLRCLSGEQSSEQTIEDAAVALAVVVAAKDAGRMGSRIELDV